MGNNFERLKRAGAVAAGLAAAAPQVAEANVVHQDKDVPQHELATQVHIDAGTRLLMEAWGVEFNGSEIRLRLDSSDNGRPLQAGERNKDVTFRSQGADTIVVDWREADGDHGSIWIKYGQEVGRHSTQSGQAEHHGSSGEHTSSNHPGPHIFGMHAEKPPAPPGKKWYYQNPVNNKDGYWYLAPNGSR